MGTPITETPLISHPGRAPGTRAPPPAKPMSGSLLPPCIRHFVNTSKGAARPHSPRHHSTDPMAEPHYTRLPQGDAGRPTLAGT